MNAPRVRGKVRRMAVALTLPSCPLLAAVDTAGRCRGAACSFWDGDCCLFQELDLRGRADVAAWLLDLRESLEAKRDVGASFRRRLAAGSE